MPPTPTPAHPITPRQQQMQGTRASQNDTHGLQHSSARPVHHRKGMSARPRLWHSSRFPPCCAQSIKSHASTRLCIHQQLLARVACANKRTPAETSPSAVNPNTSRYLYRNACWLARYYNRQTRQARVSRGLCWDAAAPANGQNTRTTASDP